MTLHSLTNFEIQKYYQNELRFNGVYSRDTKNKGWGICNKSLELIGLLCTYKIMMLLILILPV